MWRQNDEQPRLVARDERLERVMVAAPDEGDQPLVRLETEQRRAPVPAGDAGVLKSRDFHRERGPKVGVRALSTVPTVKLRSGKNRGGKRLHSANAPHFRCSGDARGGTRTHTPSRVVGLKPTASSSSATRAEGVSVPPHHAVACQVTRLQRLDRRRPRRLISQRGRRASLGRHGRHGGARRARRHPHRPLGDRAAAGRARRRAAGPTDHRGRHRHRLLDPAHGAGARAGRGHRHARARRAAHRAGARVLDPGGRRRSHRARRGRRPADAAEPRGQLRHGLRRRDQAGVRRLPGHDRVQAEPGRARRHRQRPHVRRGRALRRRRHLLVEGEPAGRPRAQPAPDGRGRLADQHHPDRRRRHPDDAPAPARS